MEWLAERLAEVQGVVAVALGGSRAQGTERPHSDWDFGLYHEDTIDPDEIHALGYPSTIVAPGEWAYPMNGGAWLSIEGQKVDIHYRDLDDVRRWTEEAGQGCWSCTGCRVICVACRRTPSSPNSRSAGCSSEAYPGPSSPNASGRSTPGRWRWEAGFALQPADAPCSSRRCRSVSREVVVRDLGRSTRAICERREWVTSEKHLAEQAELADAEKLLDVGLYAKASTCSLATTSITVGWPARPGRPGRRSHRHVGGDGVGLRLVA